MMDTILSTTLSKHAPWRKRILIPMFTFQLALAFIQLGLSIRTAVVDGAPGNAHGNKSTLFHTIIVAFFSALLCFVVILSIVAFAIFELLTEILQSMTQLEMAIGIIIAPIFFMYAEWFGGTVALFQVISAGGLYLYAWIIRKGIQRGGMNEMQKPSDAMRLGKMKRRTKKARALAKYRAKMRLRANLMADEDSSV